MLRQPSLPFDDMDPRQQLLSRVPVEHRPIVVAVYDLADDHREWKGPARLLAAEMKCAPGTATRRAKRAAEAGLLHVDLRAGRTGRYQIVALQSVRTVSADGSALTAPTWSELGATTFRAVGMLIALTFGKVPSLVKPRRAAPLRRIMPLPDQLELVFPERASANLGAQGAEVTPKAMQRRAEVAKTSVDAAPATSAPSAEASPIPLHSIDPQSSQRSVPIVPSHGVESGTLKRWWSKDIEPQDLQSPTAVQQLYADATQAGAWTDSEQDRITFFAWAKHVTRIGSIKNKAAVFTTKLGQQNFGKPFASRMAAADLDWAQSAIKSLALGPAVAARSADLLADGNHVANEKGRQQAGLKRFERARG